MISSNTQPKNNLNLTVYLYIRQGLSPAQITKKLGIKKTALQYYLNNLKSNGLIEKIGYGVWKIKSEWKEVQKTTQMTSSNVASYSQDKVRGHAFMFTIKLPKIKGWVDREVVFKSNKIDFKILNIHGKGQKLTFKGRKVWITNKSIIIFEKSSFMANTARASKSFAVCELKKMLVGLEKLLKVDFKIGGQYKFKVSRQHYALVKNALAKQFDKEGKRLNVYSENGLWFVIDNSFNLHEAECLHSRSALSDTKKVQDFFNGIKKFENFTPEFVVNSIAGVSENQALFAKNIESHIKAIQELGKGVRRLTALVEGVKGIKKK